MRPPSAGGQALVHAAFGARAPTSDQASKDLGRYPGNYTVMVFLPYLHFYFAPQNEQGSQFCFAHITMLQCTDFPPSPTGLCISRMWVFKYYFIKTPVFLSTFHQFTTAVVWSSSESRWGGPFTIKSCSNCLQAQYMEGIGWIKGRIYIKYLCKSNRRVKRRYNKMRGLVNL